MVPKFDKAQVTEALSKVFGVEPIPGDTKFEDMDYSKVQIINSAEFPLINLIGPDGAWTFTVEFAQDGTGDIECYGAGEVTSKAVVAKVAEADALLGGFLVGGLRMFALNPDYDSEDRAVVHKLMQKVETARGRPAQRPQA